MNKINNETPGAPGLMRRGAAHHLKLVERCGGGMVQTIHPGAHGINFFCRLAQICNAMEEWDHLGAHRINFFRG